VLALTAVAATLFVIGIAVVAYVLGVDLFEKEAGNDENHHQP
jgi:hypothetical protein